jgi:hypothetical protein
MNRMRACYEQNLLLCKCYLELSTCISTISKFETIRYISNFLYQILTQYDIDRISYFEFQPDTINFEFSISNFDIDKQSKSRGRERDRQTEKQTDRETDRQTERQIER